MSTSTRYRLGWPTLPVGPVAIREEFRHPVNASRKAALVESYRRLFPASAEREVDQARKFLRHHFDLLGHEQQHGERIAWSRDPVSGREWSRDFSFSIAYRGAARLGDIKLAWELNKHQYFFTLGKAAWLTDEDAFAREIVEQIDHWIADNPCHTGIHWISALETGTRALSWILAYPFFAGACDEAFRQRMARSIGQHMLFVEQNLSDEPYANTHLVGEAAVLVAGGLFLRCAHSRRWLKQGLRHLEEQARLQVLPDGAHAEQSPAYHRFCLDHYYLIDALLRANDLAFSSATLQTMERMTQFMVDMLFPDGTAANFGDNDDARGLWCRADAPSDYRSLAALGAARFGRGDFKHAAGGAAEEVLWLYGEPGVERLERLTPHPPHHVSTAYPDAGYCIMRSGWGSEDSVLVFDCGPLGHGAAGHGHADALSFQLYARGYPFLIDPGTYSYNLDYGLRDAFRSTRAHNTWVVDGQDQSVARDRMSWSLHAQARIRHWSSNDELDCVDGEHDGYRRLPGCVTHRRLILFVKPDVWLICDRLTSRDADIAHEAEMLLHLRPDCKVELCGRQAVLRSPSGATLKVEVLATSDLQLSLAESHYSAGYGHRSMAPALRLAGAFRDAATPIIALIADPRKSVRVSGDGGAPDVTVERDGRPLFVLRDPTGARRTNPSSADTSSA